MALHTVIMAGGSGTRFWPLSRRDRPKQFIAIAGEHSMLRQTSDRVLSLTPHARQWVVCGTRHEQAARADLPALPPAQILLEPLGRNTAPCIALAAAHVAAVDPDAVLAVIPSDQFVPDSPAFCRAIAAAARTAESGRITTLGIRPTRPETGFGYIRMGAHHAEHESQAVHLVDRFVEKPDLPTAQKYLAEGTYLWNAGIFVFKAREMMDAVQKHLPELFAGIQKLAALVGTPGYDAALKAIYPGLPSISIDYGVMEKEAPNLAVVPASFAWNDVGSYAALPDVLPLDAAGNVVRGTVVLKDVRNSVVDGRAGRLVAVLGLDDAVVVDTPDVLLVTRKDRSQQVGQLLELLKAQGREDLL